MKFVIPQEILDDLMSGETESECSCGNCHERENPLGQPMQARCLNDALESFFTPCTKQVRQLLTLKKGIASAYDFHPDTLFTIAEVFDPPLSSGAERGSVHYGRKLDLGVLAYDVKHGTVWLVVDSRYFEDYVGKIE